jgi:xylulokinase
MVLVAGVDSSTQSCKVVIRDSETGALVRSGRASHPNGTEVNPSHWWDALQSAIADAGGLNDVAAISIGGQQHGMVLLDSDGNVVRDALLWNDTRSAPDAQRLIDHFGADYLASHTGSIPVASFTSTKVAWVASNEPAHAQRVAAICLPHDYLSWRLAGYGPVGLSQFGPDLSKLATDASDASGTGYFNPATGEYVTEILSWILGRVPALPSIVKPGSFAYEADATREGFKGAIAGGAGDNAAAGLGAGAVDGDVIVSLGTSGTVFSVSATTRCHSPSLDTSWCR